MVVPVRVSSRGQTELYDHLSVCKQISDVELLVLYSNTWNHLTMYKQMNNVE